jgi:hypothetical protein
MCISLNEIIVNSVDKYPTTNQPYLNMKFVIVKYININGHVEKKSSNPLISISITTNEIY